LLHGSNVLACDGLGDCFDGWLFSGRAARGATPRCRPFPGGAAPSDTTRWGRRKPFRARVKQIPRIGR
jgi:hypothetical protein